MDSTNFEVTSVEMSPTLQPKTFASPFLMMAFCSSTKFSSRTTNAQSGSDRVIVGAKEVR